MGLKGWLKERVVTQGTAASDYWSSTVPPVAVMVQSEDPTTNIENKYELYDALVDKDPELAGTLDDLASLIVTYYKGLYLETGEDVSSEEEKLIDRLKYLEHDFDFRDYINAVSYGALKYGDMLTLKAVKVNEYGRRVPAPVFLPRAYTSFAMKKNLDYSNGELIQMPKYVAVNRYLLAGTMFIGNSHVQWYKYDDILHYSLRQDGTLETDQYGMLNLNVISKSPLKPLELTLQWKRQAILMDMLWRESNVPFLHHKLDLSAYDPTRMPGSTQEEKIATAKALAKADLEEYRDGQRNRASDQGVITSNTTEIVYVEPKTQSYADPNPSIGQINNSINSRLGALQRVKDKSGGGSYAADLLMSSITEPRLRVIAYKFLGIIERYVREFLKPEGFMDELLDKVKIRMNLILPHERIDRAREALFMQQSQAFLIDEIREVMGFLPLNAEQKELLQKETQSFNNTIKSDKSAGDIVGDAKRSGPAARDEVRTPYTDRSANK